MLSEREHQAVQFKHQGLSLDLIASRMQTKKSAVKGYLQKAKSKIGNNIQNRSLFMQRDNCTHMAEADNVATERSLLKENINNGEAAWSRKNNNAKRAYDTDKLIKFSKYKVYSVNKRQISKDIIAVANQYNIKALTENDKYYFFCKYITQEEAMRKVFNDSYHMKMPMII